MNRADKPEPTEYRVTLRFTASGVPAIIRLRRFLKMAWRAYELKAVKVEQLPTGAGGRGADQAGPGGLSWRDESAAP